MTTAPNTRRILGAVLAVGVITAVAPAIAAYAEPAGCTSSVSGSTSNTGLLRADGKGSCSGSATRTLRVEIKQAIPQQTDPLLAAASDYGTKTSYAKSVTSCDNGKTAYYYGRAFFTTNTTIHDTATTRHTTC